MYELKNGSARLVGALDRIQEDSYKMKVLAQLLYYCDDQLPQDIQALVDFYEMHQEENA